jgi:hypothetical protein
MKPRHVRVAYQPPVSQYYFFFSQNKPYTNNQSDKSAPAISQTNRLSLHHPSLACYSHIFIGKEVSDRIYGFTVSDDVMS